MADIRGPLRPSGLDALRAHAYVAGEATPMDTILNKLVWTPLAEHLPRTLAPNTITLIGTLFIVASTIAYQVALALGTQPQTDAASAAGAAHIPAWTHAFAALCMFIYQTLDAVDGKQARRTRSSSPLGQLFDHGCDAAACAMALHNVMVCMGMPLNNPLVILACVASLTVFALAQWEETFTHKLRTNAGGMGVTEVQLANMGIFLTSAIWGTEVWQTRVGGCLVFGRGSDVSACTPFHESVNTLITAALCATAMMPITRFVLNVCVWEGHGVRALLSAVPTLSLGASIASAFALPFVCEAAGVPVLRIAVVDLMPGVVLFVYMLLQVLITTKVIVFSMAHQPLTASDVAWAALLPAMLAADVAMRYVGSTLGFSQAATLRACSALLGAVAMLALIAYALFVTRAIQQIAAALGIHVFRIKPAPEPSATTASKPAAAPAPAGGDTTVSTPVSRRSASPKSSTMRRRPSQAR